MSDIAALYFLPSKTTMDRSRYLNLLREKSKFHMNVHRCSILMHDGVSCHMSKADKDYLPTKKIQALFNPQEPDFQI